MAADRPKCGGPVACQNGAMWRVETEEHTPERHDRCELHVTALLVAILSRSPRRTITITPLPLPI